MGVTAHLPPGIKQCGKAQSCALWKQRKDLSGLKHTLNQTLQEKRIRHATSKHYFHIWESVQRVPKGKIKKKKISQVCSFLISNVIGNEIF